METQPIPVPATNLEATRFAPSRCQGCGAMRQAKNVTFYRNVGMLVVRRTYQVHADLCRSSQTVLGIHREELIAWALGHDFSACDAFLPPAKHRRLYVRAI
jgi:hypothetical protein